MPVLTIGDLSTSPQEVFEAQVKLQSLSTLYETFLREDVEEKIRRPGIHASEISGCQRKVVYNLLDVPKKNTLSNDWKKRFLMGHAVHDMLQAQFTRWMERSGNTLSFQAEVPITPETNPIAARYEIQSSCDGIFEMRTPEGEPLARSILEIKSMAPDEFAKLKEPKKEHVEQAHVYMACLDIPFCWFLYWNKGNQNYTGTTSPPFLVQFNPELWTTLTERFDRALVDAIHQKLPKKEENFMGCMLCPWNYTCLPSVLEKKGAAPHVPHWVEK